MKQQLTKNAIRESFLKLLAEKTFDKITVKSIVEDCGLTRNTFYYYYEDTYDILDDILTREISKYSELSEKGVTAKDIIAEFCAFAESQPNLVGHVLKSAKWDEIKVYVLGAVDKGIDLMIEKYADGREIDREKRAIIKAVYKASVGGLVEIWLQRGVVKGIGAKVEVLDELFGECIEQAVEKSVVK
ncbi:MAG: TetR family transcriptional regulator [Clostridia bacterium]|nr:TetR family transcriptional regulator [Clostridia bacterium]